MTRSNSQKIRENLNRLPREVEATLPSWVKCTDPISAETLEEVRSTVMVWVTNVENYVKETNQHFGVGNAFFVNIPLLWHLLPKYFAINYFFNIALKTRSHFRFFKTT